MIDDHSQTPSSALGPSAEWEALARYLSGECDPAEAARIDALLDKYPRDRELLSALDAAFSGMKADIPADLDVEGVLQRVRARHAEQSVTPIEVARDRREERKTALWRVPLPAVAAAGILIVGTVSWLSLRKDPLQPEVQLPSPGMLATGVGVRDSITLADGSRVVLGPLSSVKIAAGYGDRLREVQVRGDAWFDVVHDDQKPFTVRAGDATIVDLGTRFIVRSDASEGVSVSVSEGSVSLRQVNNPADRGVILNAGDNGLLRTDGEVVARRGAMSEEDTAWLRGRLVFREAPMAEVITSMRRWYGIEIRMSDSSLATRHLTAAFAGETPERALEVIGLALGAKIERRGDSAFVRPVKRSVR